MLAMSLSPRCSLEDYSSYSPMPAQSGGNLPDTPRLDDETLPSRLLESLPPRRSPLTTKPFKISAAQNDISEAALAEGFAFQPHKPPRPGQFSGTLSFNPLGGANTKSGAGSQQQVPFWVPQTIVNPPRPSPERPMAGSPLSLHDVGFASPGPGVSLAEPRNPARSTNFQEHSSSVVTPIPAAGEPHCFNDRIHMLSSPVADHQLPPERHRPEKPHESRRPYDDERATSQRDNIKLSQSSDRPHRPINVQQDRPSSEICGDLEAPTRQTPLRSRKHARDNTHKDNRISRQYRDSEEKKEILQRPQSRNSNVSKKRTPMQRSTRGDPIHRLSRGEPAHKRSRIESDAIPSRGEPVHIPCRWNPERKKLAMNQVAQYWNECMLIAEEEKEEANEEIDHLQSELHSQSQQLNETHLLLRQRQAQIQQIEEHYKAIEKKGNDSSEQNKQLAEEVQRLREDLSKSQQKVKLWTERYGEYKSKLNESIAEQQTFYKMTKIQHDILATELQESRSNEIRTQDLMQTSEQKRAEMVRVSQQLRDDAAQLDGLST